MKFSNTRFMPFVLMLAVLAFGSTAWGQLMVEDFSYTPATSLNGQGGWSAHSGAGTNPPPITTGGLSYSGYPSSGIGNAVSFTTNGEDDNKTFASYPSGASSGSLYYSLMVKLDSVATTGDYFFHFLKGSTTFSARIFAKRAANGNIRFGIGKSSTAANINYSDSIYTVGTTYLLVAKYTFIAGTTNDSVALWVNPTISGTEPLPTVFESSADLATADQDTLYGVAVRQGTAANAAIGTIDGIRVGTTWGNVVAGIQPPLSGTKTIGGASPDYATIKAALLDLKLLGTTAPGVTFLIRGGTYTEDSLVVRTSTSSATAPIVIKPDVGATVVVNVTPATTTLPSVIKIDSTKYVTIDGSNNGTTSRDLTLNSLGTNGLKSVLVYATSNFVTVKNCITHVASIASTSRNITWEYAGTAMNPNDGLIENNLVVSGYYGIRCEGNLTNDVINNITIRNNVVDSSGAYGIYVFYTNYARVYNNEIMHTGSANTTLVQSLYVGSVTWLGRFYNNSIHDPISTTTTGSIIGIAENGTSTLAQHVFYNNFIWNLSAPAAGTNAIYGIYCTSTNTSIADTFAYNTVNLSGTGTANKNSYAFYKGSATGPAYVKNNVFHNTRSDGTGITAAIGKLTAPTVLVSNNNNLYVPVAVDTTHVIGAIGTVRYKGISEWRGANSSDGASVTENTPFVSATDLHIQTTVPTQLESGGAPVAGITSDIDGNLRNVSTPDIGADEFAGIAADFTPPLVTYTPLPNTALTTSRTLTTTITDLSGVPTSGVGLPVLYWRRNSAAYTTVTGAFVSGSQYTFAFGSGVSTGDTISYFVVAQDGATTPNVGAQPSGGAGGFTANPPAASTPPTTPSSYLVVQTPMIAGDYTVGLTLFERAIGKKLTPQTFTRKVLREIPVGPEVDMKSSREDNASTLLTPFRQTEMREVEETYTVLMDNGREYDGPKNVWLTGTQRQDLGISDNILAVYPTITAAVTDLNLRGVSGSVRFLLNDATYPTEIYPITVRVTSDSVPTASKTVTLKPNTGVTATIAGTSASSQVIKVLNSYVTIDGSNTAGGSSRDLTIQNTSVTSPQVLLFGSTGTTPVVGDTLKNCVVINGVNTSTPVIISDGTTSGTAGYFSNIGIINNKIRNSYIGIYSIATVLAGNGSGTSILNNDFNATATDSIRYTGVYMQGIDRGIIRGNNFGGFGIVTGENDRAVWLATGTTNTVVEKNIIHDLGYVGGSGYGAKGIVVSTGLAAANDTVSNNMISHIFGDGDAYSLGATYDPVGIYVFGTGQAGVNIFYNSINLYGNTLNYAATVYSIGIALDDGAAASVKNNLVVNTLGLLGSVGVGPVGIAAELSNTQFTALDNNDYYSNAAAPAVNNIGKIAATDYPTLGGWVTASGGETHSISGNVNFASSTDLHVAPFVAWPVDGAGTPITGITTDFDGQTRNATVPDIGADEFTAGQPPIGILSIARNVRVPLTGDTLVVTARIIDSLAIGITADSLLYSLDGVLQPALPMPLISGTTTDGVYRGVIPGSANTNGTRVEYRIKATGAGGGTKTTAIAAANSYFAGLSPLSTSGVRAQDGTNLALYKGYYARVTGTMNGPNFQATNWSQYFQDGVGGMQLFLSGGLTGVRNLGDSIVAVGKLDQFRGVIELIPDSTGAVLTLATGRPVPIIDLTIPQYQTNPELYESRLLRFSSINRKYPGVPPWPPAATQATILMYQTNLTDTLDMFINAGTNIPGSTEPAYPITVICIGTQFTSTGAGTQGGYEFLPRYLSDFSSGLPGLVGNYTVGTGGSFPTLSRAIFVLDSAGVAGPVTFSLINTAYADTALIILPYTGQGPTNLVTFKPASGVTATITISGGSTTNAGVAVRMDSVSGIVWDGSNSGGSDRSLTIESDTNTTTGRTPILIRKGSRNVTLKNLIVKANRHSAGTIPSVVVIDNTGFASSGGQHNMTIDNCQLMRGNNGIFTSAASGAVRDTNHTFTNNLIGGGSSTSIFDNLAAAGVSMTGNHNALVDQNDINGIKVAGTPVGVRINGANTAARITRNRIHNLVTTSGAARPICLIVGNNVTTGPAVRSRAVFANNMVYDVHNFGTGTGGRAVEGVFYNPTGQPNAANGNGSTIEWYFNSFNFDLAAGEGAATSGFIFDGNFAGSDTTAGQSDSIKFYNNIGSVKRADTTGARMFLLFGEVRPGHLALQSNNNDFYFVNSLAGIPFAQVPSPYPGGTTNVFVYSLPEFRDSTRLDSSSVFGNPQFVSATDAHISTSVATPVESAARPIAGITNDLDGQTRNATTPDIGADEGNFIPANFHDIGVASLGAGPALDGSTHVPLASEYNRGYTGKPVDRMQAASNGAQRSAAIEMSAPEQEGKTVAASHMLSTTESVSHADMIPDVQQQVAINDFSMAYLMASTYPTATDFAPAMEVASAARVNNGGASIQLSPVGGGAATFPAEVPLNFRARIQNFGTFVESAYQVAWSIDGVAQTPVNNTQPLQVGAIDTLNLSWAVPTSGNHIARAWTVLGTDPTRSNDTATYSFNVAQPGIVFEEGFNQATLPPYPTGWTVKNRDGGGTSTWFQGNSTVFPAYEGSGYIGANYNAANGLFIDEWLVTPNTGGLVDATVIDSLIFWQRSPSGSTWPDSIQIRVSTTDTAVASFTTVLDYFKTDTIGWRRKAYALPSGANRYIAFRYLIYNGGASGANSDYIGIDGVQIKRTSVLTPGWTLQTSGITTQFYSVKAVNATTAWAAALGGVVLRTTNGGDTWTSVGGGRIGTADIYNITAVDANTAFVTTTPSTTTYIFRTTTGGAVWDTVFQQAGGFIDAMHMYDANNGIAVGDPVPATLWTILKTSNGGATWARIATEPVAVGGEAGTQNDLAVSGPNNVWIGSSAGGRVYRSTNAGATWTSPTVPAATTATRVISVWFNDANYGIAGHYTTSGVYNAARSTDGGTTWSATTVGAATTYNIAVAGTGVDFWMGRGTNVFKSTDRGATWAQSYTGTGTFYDVDFYTSGVNTYGWGVKDNGNIVMYYGTITGVEEEANEVPQTFALDQNYPNPFNPSTTLRYALPKDAHVTLTIYNILGQHIATLRDEVQNVGFHSVVWDGRNDIGSHISSGIYFYRIEARPIDGSDAFSSIKKMLMLK